MITFVHRSGLKALLLFLLIITGLKSIISQTYESSADGNWELQPQFFDNGSTVDFYFNMEIWDGNTSWQNEYDFCSQLNLSWDGVIFYRIEHGALYSNSLNAVDYTIGTPSTTRFNPTSDFKTYVFSAIEDDVTVTYTNTHAYGGQYEVTQVHVSISKRALGEVQDEVEKTSEVEAYSYYYDRDYSSSSNDYAGTHLSQTVTAYKLTENNIGNDEADFSANLWSDYGLTEIRFRMETREGDPIYDHISCIDVEVENLTKGGVKLLARVGHNSLSCSHSGNTTGTSGIDGDSYTFSVPANVTDEVLIEEVKRTNPPTSWHYMEYDTDDDGYFVIKHYYDKENFGDELRYYISGNYYARDYYGESKTVPVEWWANQETIYPNANYTMPGVTGLSVTPSTTDCEIDISWNAYTSFGDPTKNRVNLYRNGVLIASLDPQSTTTYTDSDVTPGIDYSYQVASAYNRDKNGQLIGNYSTAITESLPVPDAPFGLVLTQSSCAADITVDWGWTGADPGNFILQRKTSATGFQTISSTIPGGARSYIDNNGIVSGEVYSYRIAAIDGLCGMPGMYSDVVTLTGDTIDISPSLVVYGLETSKGYFANRTELFWSTTGNNDQYLDRFKIYIRELGSTAMPALLQTVNESVRSLSHQTGDAGVPYEYFIVGERVVSTACGTQVTSTFEIEALDGVQTQGNLPSDEEGICYAVGFRYPTGIVNGNITYSGGVAVPDVKVIAEKYNGNNGNSLYFNGYSDRVAIAHDNSLMADTAFTISLWIKPEALSSVVLYQKNQSYGIEYSGVSEKPFAFFRDPSGTAHTVSGGTGSIVVGTWVNLTVTYSSSTGDFKIFVDGELSGQTTIPGGQRDIKASTTTTYLGCQTGDSYFYQGYMDEVKFYNRALSEEEVKRAAGAVSATDMLGLMGYWKLFVGVGSKIYDVSHAGSTYHRNDGYISGAIWSNDIPATSQLGFAGYTDANGNYSITGIGYGGVGENFNIIPTATIGGAVHEFDPSARTLFIGEGNSIHNNIDFEDISSFNFSGNVTFDFDDIEGVDFESSGSEGVRLYLDGTTVITASNNQPFETDETGFFSVDVPIGQHYIEFRKNGHSFKEGGRFPATGTWDFQEDVSGVQMWDTTTHILAGKVVGGTFEGDKPVGMSKTENNIGQAYFTLTSEDGKIIRDVITDPVTGEYEIVLPPKKYISGSVKWLANNVDIVNSGDIQPINLATVFAYNGNTERDSIFVNDTLVGVDSAFYNLRRDFVYRVVPQLVVSDTNGTNISGEQYYQFNRQDTVLNVNLSTLPYPSFFSAKEYALKMQAVEIYTNLDNGDLDSVLVTDGQLTINNNIGLGYKFDDLDSTKKVPLGSPEMLDIEAGEVTYMFKAMDPNINEVTSSGLEHTSFTKNMTINLSVGDYDVAWPNPAQPTEPFRAYVIGAQAVGNSFVTKAPPVVDLILRDPPGSNSYAFWDNSVTHYATQEFEVGGFVNTDASVGVGVGTNTLVGGGLAGVGEIAESHLFGTVGFSASIDIAGGGEFSQATTFDESIETNGDPIQVGKSDVYVAKTENLQSGIAVHVRPVPVNECGGLCYGDTMYTVGGDMFRMSRVYQNYINPMGTPTYTVFSESHIVNVLLPDLKDVRNTFLTTGGDYTSNIPPNDPLYGTNNDDPRWGTSATTTNYIRTEIPDFDGPSYTFAWANDSTKVDSVRYINQQIRLWEEALANNEIEKWMAMNYSSDGENISMSSGNVLTRSKTTANSKYGYAAYELSAAVSAGVDAAFDGWGLGFQINMNVEVGLRTSGKFGGGTDTELTTGYVLHDADEDDALSIDVFPSEDKNGPIFSTVGGQTSCPFEDEIIMEYVTPEYIQTLIDIQNGDIDKAQEEASAFGVIGDVENESIKYGEVSQIQASVTRLQALLSAIQAGDVVLSNATLQRDKPSLLINGAKTAQVFNVPANQDANFTLILNNESESFDAQYYAVEVLDGTNPNGLQLKIDGQSIVNATDFLVPGGSGIQKVLSVTRGPFDYDYEDVGIIIHSTCQYDPTSNDALIADTVYFDVSYIPTCSEIEIVSPDDQWVINNSFNDEMEITVGGYDVNMIDFQKIKLQYKPSNSANWTLLETYFRDTTITGWSTGSPTLPQTGNTFTYTWNVGLLPDGNYDLRAVATCALAEIESAIHSGLIDRQNIQPFGYPLPSDGILSYGEEISVQFNEPINAGLFSAYNIDVRGVLNGGDIRHDASVYFDGSGANDVTIQQVNLADKSFTIEFYAKRNVGGVDQTILSHGVDAASDLSIGFNSSDQIIFDLGAQQVIGSTTIDMLWHHYAITYNKTTEDAILYVDGVIDAVDNSFDQGYTNGNENLMIGVSSSGSTAALEGNVHELRIWSKELSAGEINIAAVKRMTGNEEGLLFNWELEDAQGTVASDKVRGKHGQMNATWVVEPTGYSLKLNGGADEATLGAVAYDGSTDFTVEFWFKSDGGVDEVILSNGTGDAMDVNTSGWSFGVDPAGKFYAVSNDEVLTSLNMVTDGQWHHAALVTNTRGNAVLYLDAIEEQSITSDSLNGFAGPALWIGQRGWYTGAIPNSDKFYSGNVDELRIWKTARTLEQIDRDRFNKLSGDEPGLDEYYPFEEYTVSQGVASVTSTLNNQSSSALAVTTDVVTSGATEEQVSPTIKLPRPVEAVNFTYVINGDKIIITPTANDADMENVELDFTVSNVQDLNGNYLESPVTWTAYVDRNQVVWQDDYFSFDTVVGHSVTFTTQVVNNSGQNMAFDISNIPGWMQVSPTSGNVGPLSTIPVTITIPNSVNAGTYQEDLHLTTNFGFAELLEVNLKVREEPPADWTVDPAQYQYSMNIIGQIAYDGVITRNGEDLLGVFVDGECRGVAQLQYISAYDNYQVFMSIYSNQPTGEILDFNIWQSTTGDIHPSVTHNLPSDEFVIDAFYGSGASPKLFDANDDITGMINVPQGWKWISFNLNGTDLDTVNNLLEDLTSASNDIIKTRVNLSDGMGGYFQQNQFDTYDTQYGWQGTVTSGGGAKTGVLYKINSGNAGMIEYEGELVSPELDTINILTGWNYVGYVGNVNISLTDGMANFIPTDGDVLKSQYQSAIYDAGFGWIGNLTTLEPNVGYMLKSATDQQFTFPLASTVKSNVLADAEEMITQSPWEIDYHAYPENMTFIARIENDDEQYSKYLSDKGMVGAFINGECRGIGNAIYDEDNEQYVYFITVAGVEQEEQIRFQYFDTENSLFYVAFETAVFGSDAINGNLSEPFALTLEESKLSSTGTTTMLYPNPIDNEGMIQLDLSSDTEIEISIEDVNGRLIEVVNYGTQKAGNVQLRFDASTYANGIYMLVVKTDDAVKKDKIVISH